MGRLDPAEPHGGAVLEGEDPRARFAPLGARGVGDAYPHDHA